MISPEDVGRVAQSAGFPLAGDRCEAVASEWNAALEPEFRKLAEADLGRLAPAVRFNAVPPARGPVAR